MFTVLVAKACFFKIAVGCFVVLIFSGTSMRGWIMKEFVRNQDILIDICDILKQMHYSGNCEVSF